MKTINKFINHISIGLAIIGFAFASSPVPVALAEGSDDTTGFSMSPMYEKVVLSPGESYSSSFQIRAPESMSSPLHYRVYTQPYFRNQDDNAIFENVDGMGQIAEWTSITSGEKGSVQPGQYATIDFNISVPEDAPAGGQYMVVTVGTDNSANNERAGNSFVIQESLAMGYTVYAEITGTTYRRGEITDVSVPSFLTSGDISGSATIKNTGNIHGTATYKLQVYPLFSDEEIFTNEEDPNVRLIMPNLAIYSETVWENTPLFGIFNVVYTVEFEGVTQQVSKLVVKCPIWLMLVILFVILAIIIWLVMRIRSRARAKKEA